MFSGDIEIIWLKSMTDLAQFVVSFGKVFDRKHFTYYVNYNCYELSHNVAIFILLSVLSQLKTFSIGFGAIFSMFHRFRFF